jgi:hypothetical protein
VTIDKIIKIWHGLRRPPYDTQYATTNQKRAGATDGVRGRRLGDWGVRGKGNAIVLGGD